MTEAQRLVLARFDSINAGSIRFENTWVWKEDIRNDPGLAERMAAHFQSGQGCEFKSKPTWMSPWTIYEYDPHTGKRIA